MKKDSDILLHEVAKHTNLSVPFSDYVKGDKFPNQIVDLLNTDVTIKYRNYYHGDIETILVRPAKITKDGVDISTRPYDDYQFMEPRELTYPDDVLFVFSEEDTFRVIRADKEKPYVFIGISKDSQAIVVGSTELNELGHYKFLDNSLTYPFQLEECVGVEVLDQYAGDINRKEGYTFRVDRGEECISVIMELLEDNIVRFVLGDEVMVILKELPKPGEIILTNDQLAQFRKSTLEGKIIYGTV